MAQELNINLAHISTKQSLHELLAAVFDFPDFYGMNWDAFRDCVLDPELSNLPMSICIKGINILKQKLPQDAQIFVECLSELMQERPQIQIQFVEIPDK